MHKIVYADMYSTLSMLVRAFLDSLSAILCNFIICLRLQKIYFITILTVYMIIGCYCSLDY